MESSLEGWFTMILSGISVNIYVYCLSTKRVKVIDCLPNVAVDFFRYYCKKSQFSSRENPWRQFIRNPMLFFDNWLHGLHMHL